MDITNKKNTNQHRDQQHHDRVQTSATAPWSAFAAPSIEGDAERNGQMLLATATAKVTHKMVRQLLQALLFENIIDSHCSPIADSAQTRFSIPIAGGAYVAHGCVHHSFGLIRLDDTPIYKIMTDTAVQTEATLESIISDILLPLTDADLKTRFITELRQTFIKDVQSVALTSDTPVDIDDLSYEQLEQHLMAGHPYHPCYKSRIGFDLQDNYQFGPEFGQDIEVLWLAVDRALVVDNAIDDTEPNTWVRAFLGAADYQILQDRLATAVSAPHGSDKGDKRACSAKDYALLPVHPWQWQHTLISALHAQIASQSVICLGHVGSVYRAQQSIRSLTCHEHPKRDYLKLSMHLTNTSSTRILAKHTVMNAPVITKWLTDCIGDDATAQRLGFAFLGERFGVALDHEQLQAHGYHHPDLYGGLGAIWRESVHQYLTPTERAFPLNGISAIQPDGSALIAPWIARHGLQAWVEQLLEVCITPLMHLLFAHGIALESHAQNIVLVHEQGYPVRILLKDLHDGVRYSPVHLATPKAAPVLHQLPAAHAAINRGSFIETSDTDGIRDFSVACLFFVALSDIAIFLQRHYDYDESVFWQHAAACITRYQDAHPQHQARYAQFDVFAAQTRIESLTKRRLFGDAVFPIKFIDNPLQRARQAQAKPLAADA